MRVNRTIIDEIIRRAEKVLTYDISCKVASEITVSLITLRMCKKCFDKRGFSCCTKMVDKYIDEIGRLIE